MGAGKEEVRDFVLHYEAVSLKLGLYGSIAGGQAGEATAVIPQEIALTLLAWYAPR